MPVPTDRKTKWSTPRELYDRPANTFVAGFIGSPAMNLCTVPVGRNGAVSFGGASVPLPASVASGSGRGVVLGFRPESVDLAADGLAAEVAVVEEVGADAYVFCVAEVAGEKARLVARTESRRAPRQGEHVRLRPRVDEVHVFDPETGERLGRP